MGERYAAAALKGFARALLEKAGMEPPKAGDVALILVEGDLLGHDTHGLALLAPYLRELEAGTMAKSGQPEVLKRRGATETWDGKRLPGPWLTLRALDRAMAMAREFGTGTVVIRRSHHIACLAAYLRRLTEQGLVVQILCSDANSASVAPFGGTQAVFTPNPIAIGFPTVGDPVLVDISASLATNALTNRLRAQGAKLPHAWLLDGQGQPSDDPATLAAEPKGTILPLGGLEAGHKGYGLALLVEAMTGGLAGFGRADAKQGWGATVFVQVLDPEAFAGLADFKRQTQWVADACRANAPRPGLPPVRLPGDGGLARRQEQLAGGIALHPDILPAIAPWAEKLGVPLPAAA
ncbi:MAG TPA: Ldh family oxidoreductase [Usitatibacteraceae bacterium]|nr:Ldh family oxidoreductase [Usitatibacteraceae bacterium]